jgi:hypothetical protein
MVQTVRLFLLVEGFAFLTAALTHFGLLFPGYGHRQASIAESVIACALFLGAGISFARPSLTRRAGLLSQGFALFGTLVGIFTIVVGVGPRTLPDVVFHVLIVGVLATGLWVTLRGREVKPSGSVV